MKQGNIAEYNFIFLFKPLFTLGLRCICITNLYLVAVKHDLLWKVLHLTQVVSDNGSLRAVSIQSLWALIARESLPLKSLHGVADEGSV